MRRFRATYRCAAELAADDASQLTRGGLLVRVPPPEDLILYEPVELEIVFGEARVSLRGQVVLTVEGLGVAIGFEPALLDVLRARVGDDTSSTGEPTVFELLAGSSDDGDGESPPEETSDAAPSEADRATRSELIQLALHGGRDDRNRIIRGRDPTLHTFVLKNPKLTLDEVAALAKSPTTAPDALKTIAERRDWFQRPEVATGLVRNPRTPVPIAIRMLEHIAVRELRRIAKHEGVRGPILRAARKKVTG